MANNTYKINGFEFVKRLEKAWTEKENTKPKENRRKYSQRVLAEDIDVEENQISRWNKEIIGCPSIKTLVKIKETLNCSIDYLIGSDSINKYGKIDLLDIIKQLLIYDINNNDEHLTFSKEREQIYIDHYKMYGVITIEDTILYKYSNLFEEYTNKRNSIEELKEYIDITEKDNIIDKLIDRSLIVGSIDLPIPDDLPFK